MEIENLLKSALALRLNNAIVNSVNKAIFIEDRGFVCIVRQIEHSGCLCGYVVTPMNHKINKGNYVNDWDIPLDCHGGVTFTEGLTLEGIDYSIIGFDCAHSSDYMPKMPIFGNPSDYKDVAYVSEQLRSMVDQLLEMDSLNITKSTSNVKQLLLD